VVSTHGRTRDLVNMAKDVGLEVVSHHIKQNRVCIEARAENGASSSFSLSNSSRSDIRGDLNEQSRMKRFARANASQAEQLPNQDMQRDTIKLKKDETAAAQELTPIEFYRLCEWVKLARMNLHPNLAALALAASHDIGQTVSERAMGEAMQATNTKDPDHWTPLADPHTILARELEALLKQLGQPQSSQFTRLLETLK
jgi:hypothetical protein